MVSGRQTGTTIARVDTPKGTEPQGRRRRILAACLALADHFGGLSVGGARREDGVHAFTSVREGMQVPGGTLEGAQRFGGERPRGWLRCREIGFGRLRGAEEALEPRLRPGFE